MKTLSKNVPLSSAVMPLPVISNLYAVALIVCTGGATMTSHLFVLL